MAIKPRRFSGPIPTRLRPDDKGTMTSKFLGFFRNFIRTMSNRHAKLIERSVNLAWRLDIVRIKFLKKPKNFEVIVPLSSGRKRVGIGPENRRGLIAIQMVHV